MEYKWRLTIYTKNGERMEFNLGNKYSKEELSIIADTHRRSWSNARFGTPDIHYMEITTEGGLAFFAYVDMAGFSFSPISVA